MIFIRDQQTKAWGNSGQPPALFVNWILLENDHTHLFTYCLCCFRDKTAELNGSNGDNATLKAPKYFLSGLLQKKIANRCLIADVSIACAKSFTWFESSNLMRTHFTGGTLKSQKGWPSIPELGFKPCHIGCVWLMPLCASWDSPACGRQAMSPNASLLGLLSFLASQSVARGPPGRSLEMQNLGPAPDLVNGICMLTVCPGDSLHSRVWDALL